MKKIITVNVKTNTFQKIILGTKVMKHPIKNERILKEYKQKSPNQ